MLSEFDQKLAKENNLLFLLDLEENICKNCGSDVTGQDICKTCGVTLSPPWWKRGRSYHQFMKTINFD